MPSIQQVVGGSYTAYVPDDDQAIALGYTDVNIYWGPSETGPFTLVDTIALVDGQKDYTHNKTDAAATDWAYHTLIGSGPGESPASPPVPIGPPRATRRLIRQGVGRRLRICEVLTVGNGSGTTTVQVDDLIDPDASPSKYANRFLRMSTGALAGTIRRARSADNSGYAPATGIITVNRSWGGTPALNAEVEVWKATGDEDPSVIIDDAMNDVLSRIWFEENWVLSIDDQVTEYVLPDGCNERTIRNVEWMTDSYPDRPGWQKLSTWSVTGGVISLYRTAALPNRALLSAGDLVRVNYAAMADRMDDDDDYWPIRLEWATAEVCLGYLNRIGKPDGKNEAIEWERLRSSLQDQVQGFRAMYTPLPEVTEALAR